MRHRWLAVFAVLGVLLFALGFVLAPGYACSDVGYSGTADEASGGFAFEGVEDGSLHWTPDGGVNSCSIGIGILATPLGVLIVAASVVVKYRS